MTDDAMNLQALAGKSADADFLRGMIGFAARRLMDPEVGGLTGAGHGEKSSDRLVQRNDCRERDRETRAGTVEPRIPRLRTGSYFPAFPEPRRLAEKGLTAVVQEACIQGGAARGSGDAQHRWKGCGGGRRGWYMTLESIARSSDDPAVTLPAMAA